MEKVVRKANLKDARQINKLVFGYAKNGKMLSRPLSYIAPRIRDFFVCVVGNEVVGCVGLRVWSMRWAEIMALAVSREYEGDGIGSKLIKACLEEARVLGIKRVAMLTFNHDLAEKFGFQKTDNTDMFPESMFTEKTISVDKAYILKMKLRN